MRDTTKIRNYTTEISASRTIAEIEQILATAGANKILKDFRGDGRVEAISFMYQNRGYKLPANTEKVLEIISKGHSRTSNQILEEQAERVAWRVIKDWLDAQISLIRIGQAEVAEVFLPYMWNGKRTLFEILKESNYQLTGSTTPEPKVSEGDE
jgi:hypothetical protein